MIHPRRWFIALALLAVAPLAAAQSAQQVLQAEVSRASTLVPHEAAALVTSQLLGGRLPDALQLELLRFLRDQRGSQGQGTAAANQFSEDLSRFLLGALASGGPRAVNPADLGLPSLPLLPGEGGLPDLNSLYTTYGLANTLAYLVAAVAVPDLGPWVLPHNVRVVANHIQTATRTETTGQSFVPLVTANVAVGQNFTIATTVDIDTLIGTALDQHTVNDLILIQVPLSTTIAVTTTCTSVSSALLGRRCTNVSLSTATQLNDDVLASHPTYTVAYPLNAGHFATRAEATDLFMVVYDALGTLHSQKARDSIATSPFAAIPGLEFLAAGTGLGDLGTQAPPVNFYGAQVAEASLAQALAAGVVNPALVALQQDEVELRTVPPTPSQGSLLPLSLSAVVNGITVLDLDQPLDPRLGVTAGYRAEEVRAGNINIMVLRWHNVGTETVGTLLDEVLAGLTLGSLLPSLADALASAPASIYYDVPPGAYRLTDTRVDGRSAVYAADFAFAGVPPALTVPPNLPSAEDLQALAEQLQSLLDGGFEPEIPGLD